MNRMDISAIPERILSKFHITPGCWEWTAAKIPGGCGSVAWGGRSQMGAHRVLYELLVGPIGEGLQIDHLCRNRGCVNPAHMEPVTIKTNVLRGAGRTAVNARKTHCKRGHPLSGENLYVLPSNGYRQCRICRRLMKRLWRAAGGQT